MSKIGVVRALSVCSAGFAALALLMRVVVAPSRSAALVSETTWGGPVSEVTAGVAVAADGSTYLTGFTTSFHPFGQLQLFLVKHAADGTIAWQRTSQGPGEFGGDQGTDVVVASDGSVYVTGSTQGNRGDVLLLKFSSDGALLWQRRWDSAGTERGVALALAGDGSVYVVGGTNLGDGALVLLRLAADGTLLSQRTLGAVSGDGIGTAVLVGQQQQLRCRQRRCVLPATERRRTRYRREHVGRARESRRSEGILSALKPRAACGIGLLVVLLVRANRQGRRLLAFGLSDHYRQNLELTRLDEAIGIYDDEEQALAAAGR